MKEGRRGEKWTREELVEALKLYRRLPFGKLSSRTTEIIELAAVIPAQAGIQTT